MGVRLHGGCWLPRERWRQKAEGNQSSAMDSVVPMDAGCSLPDHRMLKESGWKPRSGGSSVEEGDCFLPVGRANIQPHSLRKTQQTSWIRENFKVRKFTFTSIRCPSSATKTMLVCLHGNNTNLGPLSLSNDLKKRTLKCLGPYSAVKVLTV